MDMNCPRCARAMEHLRRGRIWYWRCICGGHVLAPTSVRRMLPEGLWVEIWPALRAASRPGNRDCPVCGMGMEVSTALASFGARPLDICDTCQLLWLDPGEFEEMPKVELPPEMPLAQRQAIGLALTMAANADYDQRIEAFEEPLKEFAMNILSIFLQGFAAG